MALQKEVLKAALIAGFQAIEHDGTPSTEQLCEAIANAIDDYIQSGEVTVTITGGVCPATSSPHIPCQSTGVIR